MEILKKTVADMTDKLTKKRIELMLNEATSNEPWGVPNTLLGEISEKTYYGKDCEDCVAIISKKLQSPDSEYNRIYKVLTLIEYLLKHASNTCCDGISQHAQTIRLFQEFRYNDNGVERGQGVREKARIISALLGDHRLLTQEREAARDIKRKYVGIGAGDYIGPGSFDNYRPNSGYQGSNSGYQGSNSGYQGSSSGYQGSSSGYQGSSSGYQGSNSGYQGSTSGYQGGSSYSAPTTSYQTNSSAFNSEFRSDRLEKPNQFGSFAQERGNVSSYERKNVPASTAYAGSEVSPQSGGNYPDIFSSKPKSTSFTKPSFTNPNSQKTNVQGNRTQVDLLQEGPSNPDIFAPRTAQKTGIDIFGAPVSTQPDIFAKPSKNVDIFNQPPKASKPNIFEGLNSKKTERPDMIETKPSTELLGLTSDLFQPSSAPELFSTTQSNPVSQLSSKPDLLPELFQTAPVSPQPDSISAFSQPNQPEKSKFVPLTSQLYQASTSPQPTFNQAQSSFIQPQQPIPEPAKPKINLNLASTSGPTISQLQSIPSLVNQPSDKEDSSSSKPKNIEDAILNLDGLGASLSSSKVLPGARKPSFNI
jgi:epsin